MRSPLMIRRLRRGRRGRRRRRNHNRLSGLQFAAVFDVIEFLQFVHANFAILAMEVSVSPRATVCVLPSAGRTGSGEVALVAGGGAASPIITPGRM